MHSFRRLGLIALTVLSIAVVTSHAEAQSYPNRPIRMIAPFPAGGLVDVLARAVGDELSKALGQPVIVENKPGAGGNIGADIVAKADPRRLHAVDDLAGHPEHQPVPLQVDAVRSRQGVRADLARRRHVDARRGASQDRREDLEGPDRRCARQSRQAHVRFGGRGHDRPSRPGAARRTSPRSTSPTSPIAERRRP